ncbi:speckle-type POZ protein B [Trichonephila inaurata madagascariensis]|uniref:Speckle-type POZ protein B n=1 Tax=Trichonephila inaurata madagascariensis TaxID=2747483 RepID=A0A8X6IMT4_9ARAC|nr:speckle-type POZ protein B [Trichonephila inaurata madagascariensis]
MVDKESENRSSYKTSSISEPEEASTNFDAFDFFIATRIPVETYKFKWNINLFSKLSANKDLYSPYICELNHFCCKLKLVKYENGIGLFHVYQTRKGGMNPIVSSSTLFTFGRSNVNNHNVTLNFNNKNKLEETAIPQAIEYQVFIADTLGRVRITWSAAFVNINDHGCCSIGEYRSNSWKTFFDDILVLHICMKMIRTPETEKQIVNDVCSFEYPAWQKLSEDLKFMYKNSLNADCILVFGTNRIRVNSSILATRSPVFKEMLHHNTEKNALRSVAIEDVPLPTLKRLLMFLYTGTIEEVAADWTLEDVSELYSAANKYQVNDLRKMCASTLLSMVSVDNVTSVLKLASLHDDKDLKLGISNFIRHNYDIIVGSDTWRSFMDKESGMAYEILSFCAHKFNTSI